MSGLLTGIVPVFAMIALGWSLKQVRFLADDGWRAVERLTYFVFYPAFLVPAVWGADFSAGTAGPVALSTIGVSLAVVALTILARPALLRAGDSGATCSGARWSGAPFTCPPCSWR